MTGEEPALPTVRLHGRAPQLSRVRAWWHQPPAHRTALLVAGEPGLGRTAVLRWAARVLGAGSTGHLVAAHADVDVVRTDLLSIGVKETRDLVRRSQMSPA
ncbi:hypothetical protein ABZ630_25395, partial [Streptomyces albidoflavus]